jgi:hypothetical protein
VRRLAGAAFTAAAVAGLAWAIRTGNGAVPGFVLGVFGTATVQAAVWMAVGALGKTRHPLAVGAAAAAFLLKLPVLVAFWILSRPFGSEGPNAFVAGLLLVYSGTLAWALVKR